MVRILWGIIGLMVFVLPAPPARGAEFMTWSDTGGKAHTISIGGDGSVWVLSFNKVGTAGDSGLHRWDAKARMWRSHRIGGGVKLAVDPTGTPWLVNALGDISRWTGEGWDRLPGKAKAIAIGANGAVWILGTNPAGTPGDFGLHRWNPQARIWEPLSSGGGVTIAVDPQGNPWVVTASGDISRWTGAGWERLPGKARAIGIGANGTTWIVGTDPVGHAGDFGLHRWNAQARAWEPLPTGGGVALAVTPDGLPVIINSHTQVFLGMTSDGQNTWDRFKTNMRNFFRWIRGKTGG